MKEVVLSCDGGACSRKLINVGAKEWLIIGGGNNQLNVHNGLNGGRFLELKKHQDLHFCSRECFDGYFFL